MVSGHFGEPYAVTAFKTIRARAEKRKGGPKALARLLPARPDPKALARLGDDRILAEMTKRVFCAGFAWSVIESKWPGFEKAFLGFKPGPLSLKPDEFWDDLMKDTRIVRNGAKIMSVRANASFVRDIAREHGSFGKFLAQWPPSDEAGTSLPVSTATTPGAAVTASSSMPVTLPAATGARPGAT